MRAETPSSAPTAEGGEDLKDAIKTLQRTLAEREQALSRIVRELDQERSNRETMELEARHLHEKLDSAEHTFAREHARVLSEAETNWQKQFAVELEQMKARAEAAESASAEVRKRMQDMARLEGEVNHLRAMRKRLKADLRAVLDIHGALLRGDGESKLEFERFAPADGAAYLSSGSEYDQENAPPHGHDADITVIEPDHEDTGYRREE